VVLTTAHSYITHLKMILSTQPTAIEDDCDLGRPVNRGIHPKDGEAGDGSPHSKRVSLVEIIPEYHR